MPLYQHKGSRPTVGRDVFIAPNATVLGDVVLCESSSIWFGAVLRGDVFPIRIGARTNIQDNSVVHVTGGKSATTIGDDVTVGHLAIIHGCTIGSRCLVGMGSVVLDDAVVEDDCFIAAGTLIPPRMRVPARSMVMGRPGKVVRTIGQLELDQVREAASLYVQYARDAMTELKTL